MEIKGKVHLLFEQSGTFKNEFIKLGYNAYDYDIQNNFGETDFIVDLFYEIENSYSGVGGGIFGNITKDDLVIAFFPCIYFTGSTNPCYYTLGCINYKNLTTKQKTDAMLKRSRERQYFFELIIKLVAICLNNGYRLIIENPYSTLHYLHNNFFKEPDVFDINRQKRGDYFKKPTGYWFFNCSPTIGFSYQTSKLKKTIKSCKGSKKSGLCSEERSLMSSDYARNFICDFVLGKVQKHSKLSLF